MAADGNNGDSNVDSGDDDSDNGDGSSDTTMAA